MIIKVGGLEPLGPIGVYAYEPVDNSASVRELRTAANQLRDADARPVTGPTWCRSVQFSSVRLL